MTVQRFLDWEDHQKQRHEFDGFRPVAVTGGTINHAQVRSIPITALFSRLGGSRCRAFGGHLKVLVAGSVRRPDAFVVCSPVIGTDTVIAEPVVVFGIPGTSRGDRITRSREYRDAPSILRSVILEQDTLAATVFNKVGGDWTDRQLIGAVDLPLPDIGISIPLAELYEGVELAVDPVEDQLPQEVPRIAPRP